MPTDFNPRDVFPQMQQYAWRGISFPVADMAVSLHQDHAQHKWPDRDGAHVEATGRSPLMFKAKIPFRLGASPGQRENWGTLYPFAFRRFFSACADRTTGDLIHPEFGTIKAKCQSCEVHWDANRRDGCDVDASWVESTETESELTAILAAASTISGVVQFGVDLDEQMKQLTPNPRLQEPGYEPDLGDALRQIQAAFDTSTLVSKQLGGAIDHILYRVSALGDAIDARRDVSTWPAQQSVEHLKSSLNDMKNELLLAAKDVKLYVTAIPQTLAQICQTTGNTIADILKLNTQLARAAVVDARTVVRYYDL